jgi:hypothetical protein
MHKKFSFFLHHSFTILLNENVDAEHVDEREKQETEKKKSHRDDVEQEEYVSLSTSHNSKRKSCKYYESVE